jgi:hypothetical protein
MILWPSPNHASTNSKTRVNEVAERLAKFEGMNGTPQAEQKWGVAWLPAGGLIVAILAVTVTLGIHLDNKIGLTGKDTQALGTKVGKIEDAVKAIGDAQKDATKQLVHDLLTTAKAVSSTQPELSTRAFRASKSLISAMKQRSDPANPQYFVTAISELDSINAGKSEPLMSHVSAVRLVLADYRSSLEAPPERTLREVTFDKTVTQVPDRSTIVFRLKSGVEMIQIQNIARDKRTFANTEVVFDTVNMIAPFGASQTLDGIHWHNIAFVGAHIIYLGGDLDLQNVRFVNCTFEVPSTRAPLSRVNQFIDYAALGQSRLTFGMPQKG